MEFRDDSPEPDFPYTVFDAREGFVIDRTDTYRTAAEAYGLDSDYPDTVVILRTA